MIIARKYQIVDYIGKGKFGSVFKGIYLENKRTVAIKIEMVSSRIPLLKRETRILEYLSRYNVSNIPKVFWYGMQENHLFTVMTFLGGMSLANIPLNEFSHEQLFSWFYTAISILEKIHEYGVIHRDLKPAHFLFYENTWYLIDFGLATFISSEGKGKCREDIIGTPNYISLRIHNGIEPSKKDDMVSLGFIFLEKYRGGILPWTNIPIESLVFSGIEYQNNHILHPANQYRKMRKERDVFLNDISEISILREFMEINY